MNYVIFLVGFTTIGCIFFRAFKTKSKSTIYQFNAKTIDGKTLDFASLKGKKLLIVNTASFCGFTKQFKELEDLYLKYREKNLIIIGFPCNQFGKQDSGTNQEIGEFCTLNYGVSFIMMEKIEVRGENTNDIYRWLTKKSKNGVMSSWVFWNFQKYMIDENGFLVSYVLPFKSPQCNKIIKWIEGKAS